MHFKKGHTSVIFSCIDNSRLNYIKPYSIQCQPFRYQPELQARLRIGHEFPPSALSRERLAIKGACKVWFACHIYVYIPDMRLGCSDTVLLPGDHRLSWHWYYTYMAYVTAANSFEFDTVWHVYVHEPGVLTYHVFTFNWSDGRSNGADYSSFIFSFQLSFI